MRQGLLGLESECREWQSTIDRDIKQMQIKALYNRKNTKHKTHNRRFKSMDEECDLKATSPPAPNRSNKKLKTNMSLLYVLTHKRSNSQSAATKNTAAFNSASTSPNHFGVLNSAPNSRKSSIYGTNKITITKKPEMSSSTDLTKTLKNNFVEAYNTKKSKENNAGSGMFRKKGREGRKVVFFNR